MPTPTYDLIASNVLSSSASSVTFSSVSGYRDLILVSEIQSTTDYVGFLLQFNSDTGANYPSVFMYGTGSSAVSSTVTTSGIKLNYDIVRTVNRNNVIANIFDANVTDKHKSVLMRQNNAGEATGAVAGRWTNTAAITSVTAALTSGNFASGSTFYLYGIVS